MDRKRRRVDWRREGAEWIGVEGGNVKRFYISHELYCIYDSRGKKELLVHLSTLSTQFFNKINA